MADSTTTTQTEPSPLTGPSSFGSAVDAQGLPTVHEVPHYKTSHDFDNAMDHRLRSIKGSRDASFESSMEHNGSDKQLEVAPQNTVRYTAPAQAAREALRRTEVNPHLLNNADHRRTMADPSKPTLTKKPKRGGLRNTIRRMFSRKAAVKDRISMPNPAVYNNHDSENFITSAIEVQKGRSLSVPTGPSSGPSNLLRTSGLSSHPPFQPSPKHYDTPDPPVPPPPERRTPERPPRPRRASVPSIILNRDEVQAVTNAMTGLGLQKSQEQDVDARNIGFAVTNGSNPKRRSRSVGAVRQSDHRMSPIQWRHWRTRSDEIRYLRQSADLGSYGVKSIGSPEVAQGEDDVAAEEQDAAEVNEDFNFNIPPEERMGLEERLFTLEIKLMDFEHAISRLQASSASPSRRDSRFEPTRQESMESYSTSNAPRSGVEASPVIPQDTPRASHKFSTESNSWQNPRPTSVAATLKPALGTHHASTRKSSIDYSNRSSLPGLTVEHYTTLVTLIRHEQSARVRLEEQVTQLQRQIEQLSPPDSSDHLTPSQYSRTFSHSSSRRRRGVVDIGNRGGHYYTNPRPRSSSYSTNETDTDDDAYHDVYVTPNITPVERGEYERGAFERVSGISDGAAF